MTLEKQKQVKLRKQKQKQLQMEMKKKMLLFLESAEGDKLLWASILKEQTLEA